jgi:hypothetical protein
VRGCDIASFDIYPAVHDHRDVKGRLWMVADGVRRLRGWAGGRPVWNCIEGARIGNPEVEPTPEQVRAEVWMSLIRGSRGIIYFVHQFRPRFVEASLLENARLLPAVTALNREILGLAPALNAPTVEDGAVVASSDAGVPVEAMVKREPSGSTCVFAAAMRPGEAEARFTVRGLRASAEAEVIGENRRIAVREGRFEDGFGPYAVHLYRIRA